MAASVPESWTDQRVNQLKKLWQQGKSASEIADTLGGVTRNAVIGKAHRLGLSGRPSPIKKAPIVKKAAPAKPAAKAAPAPAKAPAKKPTPVAVAKPAPAAKAPIAAAKPVAKAAPAPAVKQAVASAAAPLKTPPFNQPLTPEVMARPLMVHDGKVISILELTEKTCRWPIGDPKDPAFGYCGLNVHPNFPYCPGHVVMAFQSSRKDTKRIANDAKTDDVVEDIDVEDIEVADGEEELDDDALDDDADEGDDLDV